MFGTRKGTAMHEQLRCLLNAVWEHDLPLGPFGDLDYRQRAELEWEASLTADDCLTLLGWVERPQLPPHWELGRERWLPGLVDRTAWHVGRVGRRIGDPRITHRFMELLAQPGYRSIALDGLAELADPTAFDTLLCCLGDRSDWCNLCIALASSPTDEQIGRLSALSVSAPTAELRKAATEVIVEWVMLRREQGIELDDVPGDDVYGAPPDQAAITTWRTTTVVTLARQMETSRDFSAMPILADALQDAGCDNEAMLHHCRGPGPHVCGCWAIDLVLGKE
jgi:hypothetical protein